MPNFKSGVSGALSGAAIGAGVGGPWGAAAGAVAGGLGLGILGDKIFGNEENERAYEMAKAREQAEQRAKQRFEKLKLDPEALKKQYAQALMRNLQQQNAGLSSALATQRGVNPALASHLISNTQAEMGANAAGMGALAEEKIGYETDLANKQLESDIFSQEYGYATGAAAYTSGGRQQDRSNLNNLLSTAATVGLSLYQKGKDTPTSPQVSGGEVAPNAAPSRLSLGVKGGYSMESNPFAPPSYDANPYSGSSFYNHDFDTNNSYHTALSTMVTGNHSNHIYSTMQGYRRRAA